MRRRGEKEWANFMRVEMSIEGAAVKTVRIKNGGRLVSETSGEDG